MSRRPAFIRATLAAVLCLAVAAPAAGADTKVTSLRPWAADNLYYVRVDLDGRNSPRLEPRAKVDYLKAGQWVKIACQTTGESAYGSTVWDKVGKYYVPDHYIKTYTDGFIPGAPRCGEATPPPPPPAAQPTRYVAMGDSYSSGEGATRYLPAAPGRPYSCHRSINAYSQWLAPRFRTPVVYEPQRDFVACSGDMTGDVARRQLSALASDARVVTIGVGGNDVNFAEILEKCIVNRNPCSVWVDHLFDLGTLRKSLDSLYRSLRARASRATIIVVGYPRLFDPERSCIPGLKPEERDLLNAVAGRLDRLTASVARAHGFRFVDPRAAFAAHGLCSRDRWISPFVAGKDAFKGSFHPNVAGQKALARIIAGKNTDVFR